MSGITHVRAMYGRNPSTLNRYNISHMNNVRGFGTKICSLRIQVKANLIWTQYWRVKLKRQGAKYTI